MAGGHAWQNGCARTCCPVRITLAVLGKDSVCVQLNVRLCAPAVVDARVHALQDETHVLQDVFVLG